ncbi:hypothetical protein Zmor_028043 [Zophobas morio]|uniref:Uncharacterized protein n=1 Tax=Zophobas morio TaxID=2755281 RepID=A0AA38M2L0_9CUCU|nr:hypothetical protein Zmor_028043 [Zophobas morio]
MATSLYTKQRTLFACPHNNQRRLRSQSKREISVKACTPPESKQSQNTHSDTLHNPATPLPVLAAASQKPPTIFPTRSHLRGRELNSTASLEDSFWRGPSEGGRARSGRHLSAGSSNATSIGRWEKGQRRKIDAGPLSPRQVEPHTFVPRAFQSKIRIDTLSPFSDHHRRRAPGGQNPSTTPRTPSESHQNAL